MVGKIGMARQACGIALAVTAVLLLTSGATFAQLAGMNGGSPSLGVPGNAAPAVGGTGIPFGNTELGAGGLSPPPPGATSGLAPFGSSVTGTTGIGGGLGATGTTTPGIGGGLGTTGTTPGIGGSTPSLGSGLSPGVMPPTTLSPGIPTQPPGVPTQTPGVTTQTPGVTNFGVGGMQRLPGSGLGTGTLR
jgi:hypothetical protein